MNNISCAIAVCFLASCSTGPSYQINNMLGGGDFVDVTHFITDKGYKPVYSANGQLCAIINPMRPTLKDCYDSLLRVGLNEWLVHNNKSFNKYDVESITKKSKYIYTYFIISDPVDVYEFNFSHNSDTTKLFFRIENGKIIMPYSNEEWVQFSE